MPSRRNFIKNISLCSAAVIGKPSFLYSNPVTKLGLQMYTVRDIIDKDVVGTIAKIAKIGYQELEIASYTSDKKFWGFEAKPFRQLLDDNGVIAPSCHFGFEKLFTDGDIGDIKTVLDAANVVGQQYVTVSYLGEQFRKSLDDYKKIAEKLNKAGELCKQSGLQLAYHNHDFEFKEFDGKQTGYDILMSNTDKDLLKFELDLFWATKAGKDPITLFQKQPGRFVMWHVKDLDKDTHTFTEVGTGMINFKTIFSYEKLAGVKHLFIEQDKVSKDVFESIDQSFRYVKNNLL